MDAETEEYIENMDTSHSTDDSLDNLMRKAVTASQTHLPLAEIDQDIEEIASTCSDENHHPESLLDDTVLRLIERTRQRREMLNQKMGKTPEAAPRKRRTPLSDDLTNTVNDYKQQAQEDSPKRQCVRGTAQDIKPDTPAIPNVKSRLHNLGSQHVQFDEDSSSAGDKEGSTPVPVPRKSLSSPPLERAVPAAHAQENSRPASGRRGRFAHLAAMVNNWEDDLSHPTIVKEEEKKPRWQPPKSTEAPATNQVSSPKKTRAPEPPASTLSSSKTQPSPAKASSTTDVAKTSAAKLSAKQSFNSSPRPYQPFSAGAARISPVKSPVASRTNLVKAPEAQKAPPAPSETEVTLRRVADTPKTNAKPPSERPISARLANWEQKIAETKTDVPATPKSGFAAAAAVSHTPRQACTPARPISTPAQQAEPEAVQMRRRVRKSIDDEPTAHPVLARMSAWEQMSSAQAVSDIKKVKPGDCTPVRPAVPKTPATASKTPAGKAATATPSLETKKSFRDSIKERAAQVNPNSTASTSPSKGLSPKKASSAMKSVQEQLVQKTQSTDMAERLRQERMSELQSLQNRWKNGILKEGEDEAPEAPKAEAAPKNEKREASRDRARADKEEIMEAEGGSWRQSESNRNKRIKLDHDSSSDRDLLTETSTETEKIIADDPGKSVEKHFSTTVFTIKVGTTDHAVLDKNRAVEEIETNTPNDNTNEGQVERFSTTLVAFPIKSSVQNLQDDDRSRPDNSIAESEKSTAETKHTNEMIIEALESTETSSGPVVEEQDQIQSCKPADDAQAENNAVADKADNAAVDKDNTEVDNAEVDNAVADTEDNAVVDKENIALVDKAGAINVDASEAYLVSEPVNTTADLAAASDVTEIPSQSDNFGNKLAALGFEKSEEQSTKQAGLYPKLPTADSTQKDNAGRLYPNLPQASSSSSTSTATGRPPRPNTLFNIVSQQKKEANSPKAKASSVPPAPASANKACRQVKFDDSFESDDAETLLKNQAGGPPKDISEQSDTTPEEECEVVMRRPGTSNQQQADDDDLSLSAFVPASVRRQSILPPPGRNNSFGSLDSFEGAPGAPPDMFKSTTNLVRLGQQYGDSSSSLDSSYERPGQSKARAANVEESVDDRDAIGDLLDEAMSDESESEAPSTSTARESPVQMRKRPSHRKATEEGGMPFSVDDYRASRHMQVLEVKQVITRNSQYVGMDVREEEVEMPTRPIPAPRQNIQERIRELQELVQQEQNIIMQTSNALNQCCSSSSHFAGSQEQVECNRILLISCQKRQSYMAEIQRLRDSRTLDVDGPGPKGSLTISDIRLPLKKEFVTKIGTSHDNTTYYFILLIRNGPQVILTQMLSTHDPMMRGSLDFPNLIKINGINGNFRLEMDIYSMSVSKESLLKDKKKKTPRKLKGSALTVQSPGGPMAVRTTSFSQVTSLQLTMRSLDKHSFVLDRLSHLSPLHGTIYMNLKCLMEANIEERGFLTMFEDVSGLGSWHRRWCVLSGNKLQFWKYPDDESRKDPIGYIDLKRCATEKVGLISRDICARPNTFELEIVRQSHKGDRNTLVTRTHESGTSVRYMLSADTKEERIVWCNKVNKALATIRTWHSDALRPGAHPPHVKCSS